MLNLDAIEKELSSMEKPKVNTTKTQKTENFWRPQVGEATVRFVPYKHNKDLGCRKILFHYNIIDKPILSPDNFGEKNPINKLVERLRDNQDYTNAKKLEAKTRYFWPVVVRGEEEKGVRMWGVGVEITRQIFDFLRDEDIGDFTDVKEGRDFKLTTVGPEVTGTRFNKTSIMPKMKTSTLSDDADKLKDLLENQPDPLKAFKKQSYEEISKILEDAFSGSEDEITSEPAESFDTKTKSVSEESKSNYKLDVKNQESRLDEFNKLFDE